MTSPVSRRFVIDMFSSRHPLWCMPEADATRIREALPDDWEVIRVREEADGSGDGVPRRSPALLAALKDAEVYCGFGVPRELFAASDRVRWVHSGAAGVGGSLHRELLESDVVFTNSAGTHGIPMAEHALAMMFHFARGLDHVEAARRRRRWERDPLAGAASPVRELTDATVGIVGYGGIGREVGRRARGLGMKVWALRRRPEGAGPREVDRMLGPEGLKELLSVSDYVVLTVPHTPDTDRLIGAAELAEMKRDAVLINVARGSIVDEDALVEALESGAIRGAGLDVFDEEPLPLNHALRRLENTVITPHMGYVTRDTYEVFYGQAVEDIQAFLRGSPVRVLNAP